MQIQNVTSTQNNYSQKHNPSFTSIKSIKCEGLYKKHPELAIDLVEAFKNNPKAMEFCNKYDVNVVFYAIKKMQDSVESSVHIFFDNASKSKAKKFFDKLIGNNEDKVVIHAWGNEYSLPRSMKESTTNLINAILPERKTADGYIGGLLNSHITSADNKIQNALNEKSKKVIEKKTKLAGAKDSETNLKSAAAKLQNSIDDLVKKDS